MGDWGVGGGDGSGNNLILFFMSSIGTIVGHIFVTHRK